MDRTIVVCLFFICAYILIYNVSGQDYVNVAMGKSYSQKNIYDGQGPPKNAANGNTSGLYDENNCIHTELASWYDRNPWWEVDLGRKYPVHSIKVWARNRYMSRLAPFTITVDNRACGSVNSMSQRSHELRCSSIIIGQTVRLTFRTHWKPLNLCELQVLVPNSVSQCDVGWYGNQCNSQCSNQCEQVDGARLCERYGGKCFGGCIAGYYGRTCAEVCHSNNCRDKRCDRDSGWCTACDRNFEGDTCSNCAAGYYGTHCSWRCRTDKCLDYRCDRDSGLCTACDGNFEGDTCSDCAAGYYGTHCSWVCRTDKCLDYRCDRDSGLCTACDGNFEGDTCSVCNAGYYGATCDTVCRSNKCLNKRCDKDSGWCTACTGYFDGNTCSDCVSGRYGPQCNDLCILCEQCERDSGHCITCKAGSNKDPPACTECTDGFFKRYSNPSYCDSCPSTCSTGTACDKSTGHCALCPPGKQGNLCDQDCAHRKYGQNCTEDCGHCRNNALCNVNDGVCPGGCEPGWQSLKCDKECNDWFYGSDCSEKCGHCKDGAVCDKKSGHCQSCEPGWYPPLCISSCDDGKYGLNCSKTCGNCLPDAVCNKTNGVCPCVTGRQPPLCDKDCQGKTYGEDCHKDCGRCKDGQVCDPVTGHCADGCAPGWTDTSNSTLVKLCQSECPSGKYGEGCNQTCGKCQGVCLHDTGRCVEGCSQGFTGALCLQAVNEDTHAGTIVGVIVPVIIIVVVAVIVFIIFRRRQRSPRKQETVTDGAAMMSGGPSSLTDHTYNNTMTSTAPLSISPLIADVTTDKGNTKGKVKNSAKSQPATSSNAIYVNVSLDSNVENACTSSRAKFQTGDARKDTSSAINSMEEAVADDDDEEMDFLQSGNAVSGDVIYGNITQKTICLSTLPNTILEKLSGTILETEFQLMAADKGYPVENGKRKANYYKNRFNSILPYDKTRVELEQVDGDDSSDYINASFIKGYKMEKAYIAAQGPRQNTQDDFWRMVWQEGVTDVVMLTNLKEGVKPKCHEYWPAQGASLNTGHMEVTGIEEEKRAYFVMRHFDLKKLQGKEKRRVTQYHYLNWMDHEVPSTTPLISFWRYVRARAPRTPYAPPLVVHCSAGVGRTGTYIALDRICDQTQKEREIDIFRLVDSLREDRCYMVQNKSQYVFLHEAVLEAYMSRDSRMQTSDLGQVFPQPVHHQQPNQRIDAEYEALSKMQTGLTTPNYGTANLEENHAKNRNPAVLPDDKHMVFLKPMKGRSQYINAVSMPTLLAATGSILTQLPLPCTVVDLWRLVENHEINTLVSLGDVEGEKAMSREIRVLHYTSWTGQVADSIPDLLLLLEKLHAIHRDAPDKPVLVQCIDGAAKSGLLCALWDTYSRMTCDNELDVYMAVRQVQSIRPESVATVEQYRFCYQIAQEYSNTYNVYANT